MVVRMNLTKKQLKLLRCVAAANEIPVTELAQATDTHPTYMSRALKDLESKGFVEMEKKGNTKFVSMADTQHASLLRKLILDQPYLNLYVLSGKALSILAVINCLNLKTWEEIEENSSVSYLTVQRHFTGFKEMGLVQKKQTYFISPRFQTIKEFIEAYQDYTYRREAVRLAGDAVVKWGCGKCFLFETEKILGLQTTGITAFPRYGAQFITVKNLYLYQKKTKKLNLEDHLLYHVLSEKTSNTLPLLITWRLNRNMLDEEKLREKAYRCKVDSVIDSIIDYMETEGHERAEFLPDWGEFTNRYKEYSDD